MRLWEDGHSIRGPDTRTPRPPDYFSASHRPSHVGTSLSARRLSQLGYAQQKTARRRSCKRRQKWAPLTPTAARAVS